jgi:stage II sporulation protein AA (anti-sigma F factor antagonist)
LAKPSDLGNQGGGEEPDDVEIRTADVSGVTVMSVSGRLDSVTSGALDTEVKNRIAAGQTRLVLDLSALDYISSAGLRVVLSAARPLRDKGAVGLAAPRPMVRQVLEIAGVTSLIKVYGSAADALAWLKRR